MAMIYPLTFYTDPFKAWQAGCAAIAWTPDVVAAHKARVKKAELDALPKSAA